MRPLLNSAADLIGKQLALVEGDYGDQHRRGVWGRNSSNDTKHWGLSYAGQSWLASAVLDTKEGIMKKQVLTLIGVLSLLVSAGSAFAQATKINVDVPFNFVVNRTTMPAGSYTISNIGMGGTLVLRGTDNKAIKLVNASYDHLSKPSDRTKLVFRCYGNRYFLSQIWMEGSDRGRQLPRTAAETEVAMDFTPHDVILSASLR